MYDGQTSEEFTSEGDQTTNKEVTAGDFEKDYGAPAIDELGIERDFDSMNNRTEELQDGLAQNWKSFLASYNGNKGTPKIKVFEEKDIYFYDGVPWSSDGAYKLDVEKSNEYVSRYLGQGLTSSIAIDDRCTKFPIVDGIKCVSAAGYPILSFCNINEAGDPIGWYASSRPRKFCAILKANDGTIYYLPCSSQNEKGFDAKGHCWPGGLSQTFLSVGKNKVNDWYFNSDNGTITGDILDKHIDNLEDIKNGYIDVYYGGNVFPQLNLEVNSSVVKALSGYTVEGFITWPN